MEIKRAEAFIELENKLNNAQLVFVNNNYYDDSTAYTCYVCGVQESWGIDSAEEEMQALLEVPEDDEDLKDLYVSFNPSHAHDDGDQFEIPLIDILDGVYTVDVIKERE